MAEYKSEGRCKALVVSGCLAQRYVSELSQEVPEVDVFLGTSEYDRIADILARTADMPRRVVSDPDFVATSTVPRVNSMPSHTAYLKIAEGCSNKCAFCIIPTLRGVQNSRQIPDLVVEAERLAASGVKEIILVAQDLTAYGVDLPNRPQLHELVAALADVTGIAWIRLMYAYPRNIREPLVEMLRDHDKVIPYLDMPIQHINGAMLKRMKRGTSPDKIRRVLGRLRTEIPHLTMRSTLIAGFPGETDSEFRELCDFVQEFRFERLGVFRYSNEEGTAAYDHDHQVDERIKFERQAELLQFRGYSAPAQRSFVGAESPGLVDGPSEQTDLCCRAERGARPEIDGTCYINDGWAEPGSLVTVKVEQVDDYDLVGGLLGLKI